jgi:hypothetical protein
MISGNLGGGGGRRGFSPDACGGTTGLRTHLVPQCTLGQRKWKGTNNLRGQRGCLMKESVGFRGIGEELSLLEHVRNGDIV